MDKMREEFEEWFWDYNHNDCTKDYWPVVFAIGCDGKYQGIACEGAWQGWKASRAALCVELPIKKSGVNILNDSFFSGHKSGFNDAIDQCYKAIESSGVCCK